MGNYFTININSLLLFLGAWSIIPGLSVTSNPSTHTEQALPETGSPIRLSPRRLTDRFYRRSWFVKGHL